jgi:predicted AlkP superfamily pyrophosphatase or phosphodiesterase
MNTPLVVIDIVGLTPSLLGEDTPHLNGLVNDGFLAHVDGAFPAVTCTAQATMLTGKLPRDHGIVGNGWYFRDQAEIWFWRQANQLVQGEKIWDVARNDVPDFTCAQLFWWYNMYADVEHAVTPRPMYPADGRKYAALYAQPDELQRRLVADLGEFPFFDFWGPKAGIASSAWIAKSAMRVLEWHRPRLSLVYLPHLDYNLQRLGPEDPLIRADVRQIDTVAGELIENSREQGADIMVVSEYGLEQATAHVHINRILREHGYLSVRDTLVGELLDAGAARAFAVADHQVAHIYVKAARDVSAVAKLLRATPGVAEVLDEQGKRDIGLDHERAGELVAVAEPGHWFTYYYWLDEARAPDFARTVDIHRKPGYDPVELFVDPDLTLPTVKIAWRLLQKSLGFRMLMDVIPLQAELVRGTHGRRAASPDQGPLLIGTRKDLAIEHLDATDIMSVMLDHYRRRS